MRAFGILVREELLIFLCRLTDEVLRFPAAISSGASQEMWIGVITTNNSDPMRWGWHQDQKFPVGYRYVGGFNTIRKDAKQAKQANDGEEHGEPTWFGRPTYFGHVDTVSPACWSSIHPPARCHLVGEKIPLADHDNSPLSKKLGT
jgi:hypothetical protein